MASLNKFNVFVQDLARGVHNLNSNTLKVLLTNSAPVSTNTVKADLTEIAAGNGYAAGGATIAGVTASQTGGTLAVTATDVTIAAAGGAIGPFRYAVVYNDTATNDPLIGWVDYGSSISLNDGDSLLIDFTTPNLLTIA